MAKKQFNCKGKKLISRRRVLQGSASFLALAIVFDEFKGITRRRPLLTAPYLQWGANSGNDGSHVTLVWHTSDHDGHWLCQMQSKDDLDLALPWKTFEKCEHVTVAVGNVVPHRIYRCSINVSERGPFRYRLLRNRKKVFEAEAIGLPSSDESTRFVIAGDCGAGTEEQKMIANQIYSP